MFSPKFKRMIVIFGRFNVKIVLAVPLGSWDELEASHQSVTILTRRVVLSKSAQKSLPLWILLINNREKRY